MRRQSNGPAGGPSRLKPHVELAASKRGESIQSQILNGLRKRGERLQQLFRQIDTDGSNSVSKVEFRSALSRLEIAGGVQDYDSLFDAWDADGTGTLTYSELFAAISSGRRHDKFYSFDADLMADERIGREASLAYAEAAEVEADAAKLIARDVLARSLRWLEAQCPGAQAERTDLSTGTRAERATSGRRIAAIYGS